jgi:FAD/FMN-containing dehydrogenase
MQEQRTVHLSIAESVINLAGFARCTGPGDVGAAVRFARDCDIYPAIRGGGHNVAGLAMLDGGMVIDLTLMKGIVVDSATRTATAQTGLTWGEFDRETALHGLATTGGLISTTVIAGLTLGGGVGWLMNRCGLVCDNTLSYDVVLANGELIRANAGEHDDLFWALKGGGGNFGVVTSITYRMYPIKFSNLRHGDTPSRPRAQCARVLPISSRREYRMNSQSMWLR